MRISVAIPTHEMKDGGFFLRRSFDTLLRQTFKDFEIVVTDNSEDDAILSVVEEYQDLLPIRYFRNPNKGMAPNTNEAMRRSEGELVKVLYLDDFLAHDNALKDIHEAFTDEYQWLVTSCHHALKEGKPYNPHHPTWSDHIHLGDNTIGSPSVLTVRNTPEMLFFDENMTWLLDCDYYKRAFEIFGFPRFLKKINVVIGRHEGQMTYLLSDKIKEEELVYSQKKHE